MHITEPDFEKKLPGGGLTQQIARQHALTLRAPEIRIRGSFSRRGTQAANGGRL